MGPFKFKPTTGIFFAILPCKPLILITMKKTDLIKFQTILFTATILIILSSCASSYTSSRNYNTKTLEIQVLKPASIGVPEGVYRYGIINQIAKSKNDPIEISKTEQETLHDNTRKSCLNGLYKYINESEAIDTAQVLNANRKFFTDTSQMFWPNIEKFCSQHNIDAIVYIDRLKIDNSTTRSSNYPVNDKYAELKLKTTWIVLFPGERKKIEKDIDYNKYEKSLVIRRELGDIRGIGLTYLYMGECYIFMNKVSIGIDYYEKALKLADSTDYLKLRRDVSEQLSFEYSKQYDFKNSYLTHLVFKEMDDSLNFIESSRTAAMLEMEYEFDKLKEKQETERKRRELIYSITAIILFLIVCIISLFYFLARNKVRQGKLKRTNLKLEKQQLKQELDFKNKELATNVMYLYKKNELNNLVVEKLLKLKYELKKSNQKPLNDIILELQSNIDKDIWDEFELRFQQVHESFYKNLNDKFPDLTSNETRLCAFLKLNMTTKEIAAITQKSMHSIDVARTRLRKKLNLTNTDTEISNFLAQF